MGWAEAGKVFVDFVRRQLISSSFSLALLGFIALTDIVRFPGVGRYDVLLVLGIATQAALIFAKLESWLDALVMASYHLLGLALESYKVRHGAWSYPDSSWTMVGPVPLYSGFMYASVASYMSVAWRLHRLEFTRWPGKWLAGMALVLVYGQFFFAGALAERCARSSPWLGSVLVWRLLAAILVGGLFWRCWVEFDAGGRRLRMPMNVAFVLIAFFVWVAENWATYFHGWVYPSQADGWEPVHVSKVLSWSLMVVVSVIILYAYKETVKALVGVRNAG